MPSARVLSEKMFSRLRLQRFDGNDEKNLPILSKLTMTLWKGACPQKSRASHGKLEVTGEIKGDYTN
jgi:hypothetical protein